MRKVFTVIILILATLVCCVSCKETEEAVFRTVHFDVSYAVASMDVPADIVVADGEKITLPTIEAEATPGNVYIWTADPVKKDRYDDSSSVTADMTLYAVEVPKSYKIIYLFEFDGVVNSPLNPTEYDSTEEIVLQAPYKTTIPFGYKFTGWCYADDPTSNVTTIAAGTKGDVVLRARIERVEYEVQYRNTKNAANPNGVSYLFGDEVTLLPLEAAGFVGFVSYADPTLVVTTLTSDFIVENEKRLFTGGVIALKAKWSEQ